MNLIPHFIVQMSDSMYSIVQKQICTVFIHIGAPKSAGDTGISPGKQRSNILWSGKKTYTHTRTTADRLQADRKVY